MALFCNCDLFLWTLLFETLVAVFHNKPDLHIEVAVGFENRKIKKLVVKSKNFCIFF